MRRRVLIAGAVAAASAVLLVRLRWTDDGIPAGPAAADPLAPNAYVRVAGNGRVTLRTGQTELGQGVHTALALIVAGELGASIGDIDVETAADDPAYANPLMGRQRTAWSASVRAWWLPLRHAAAQARMMLVAEAADRWQVDAAECRTDSGNVVHPNSIERLAFGELAAAAGRRNPVRSPTLQADADWPSFAYAHRIDAPAKCTGAAVYAADLRTPDRLVGAIRRAADGVSRASRIDDRAARALRGVRAVVPLPTGVGVIAEDTWTARRAAALLEIVWTASPQVLKHPASGALPAVPAGTVTLAIESAALLHASMEPQSCTARWTSALCEVWCSTQDQTAARESAAAAAGLSSSSIRLHTTYAGGAFGRGVDTSIIREAVHLAQAIPGLMVGLQWTREEDFALDPVRAPSRHAIGGTLSREGTMTAWHHVMQGGGGGAAAAAMPYRAPKRDIRWEPLNEQMPSGLWRAVDGGPACFAIESLVSALAASAHADAIDFRLRHLDDARARRVLEVLRGRSGWPAPGNAHAAVGCALHAQAGSWCGVVAEVRDIGGEPSVSRLIAVVDGGRIVHPDGARAQIEGALLMGLSSTLREQTEADAAHQPRTRRFGAYGLLTIAGTPQLDVYFLPSTEAPQGLGEVALPPVAPAIAEAWYTLTGERRTRLPLLTPA